MPPFDYEAAAQERQRHAKMLRDAAPNLLAALELARDHLEVCNHEGEEDEALAQINAAINNAIGKAK
jgi:hypothetical protein